MKRLLIVAGVLMIFFAGCGGSGGTGANDFPPSLVVGSITGPASLDELTGETYSITASGDTGITYQWSCNPPDAGQFSAPAASSTLFVASDVSVNTQVEITATVTSDNCAPVIKKTNITITYTPPEIPADSLANISGVWHGDVDRSIHTTGGTYSVNDEIHLILVVTVDGVTDVWGEPFEYIYNGINLTIGWVEIFEIYDVTCHSMDFYIEHTLTMPCDKWTTSTYIAGEVTGMADSQYSEPNSGWMYRCRERPITGSYSGLMELQ